MKYVKRYNDHPWRGRREGRRRILDEIMLDLRQHEIKGWGDQRIRSYMNNAKEGKNEKARDAYHGKGRGQELLAVEADEADEGNADEADEADEPEEAVPNCEDEPGKTSEWSREWRPSWEALDDHEDNFEWGAFWGD
jgi:hypothetical protein